MTWAKANKQKSVIIVIFVIAITATAIIMAFCLLALAHVITFFIWSIVFSYFSFIVPQLGPDS